MTSNSMHFKTLQKQLKYQSAYDQSLSLWPVPYTTEYVPTRFGATHVVTCGPEDGEPMVLLHAMGFSSTVWHPNIQPLAQKYKVYAIDFIGDLNKSAPSILPANREACAEWLDEVTNALGVSSAVLGGISYGGFLAVNYAIHAPHKVNKLFLLSPASTFVPLYNTFIYRIIAMSAIPIKWHVLLFIKWLSKHQLNKALVNQFHAAFKYGTLSLRVPPGVYGDDEFHKLTMPILLLLGDQEVISDYNAAFQRATQLGIDLKAEVIPGTGHLLNLENPDIVNMKIQQFLCEEPF
ncbi:hypothetical protein BVG16_22285 [Paenibacillus selenitireducens]|uniref:AB hydrolase-1 domain-containing protein n=1 Tax=Paenibacillus selenitireducens TaxID=1324314 RepID=A0A1T2X686_9BACL|nr:hypothetical protein BVG16_22285 [Paenibacillus selenitireducens]